MGLDEKLFYFNLALPLWSLPRWLARAHPPSFPPAREDGLAAQWHERWPASDAFHSDFNRLLRSVPYASAFHAPAWQSTIARPFERAGRFRLLTVQDATGLAGVLPLWIRNGDTLESVGAMISDYLDPLVRPGCESAIWSACLRALGDAEGVHPRTLVLHHVRPEFMDLPSLEAAAALEGFTVRIDATTTAQRIALPGSWEEFLAGLDPHDRREIRRKLRNAETRADAALVELREGNEVLSALHATLAFMRRSSGRKGLKAQWSYRPLFARAGPGLAGDGWLRVSLLKLQDRVVAGIICFPSARGPLVWGAGFDEAARAWSPGVVLFAMAIRQAIAEGAASFDFLRGETRCKAELGAVESPICRITLTRPAA